MKKGKNGMNRLTVQSNDVSDQPNMQRHGSYSLNKIRIKQQWSNKLTKRTLMENKLFIFVSFHILATLHFDFSISDQPELNQA